MYSTLVPLALAMAMNPALAAAAANFWQPAPGTTWQITLSQTLQQPYPKTDAIDADLFDNPATTWSAAKSSGIKTICYFSAGSYEDWRPDAAHFNKTTDLGGPLDGWPGEWWLNTRSPNVRRIMAARLALAAQKGCDAVDPDNVDAYGNGGGGVQPRPLTQDDAVEYVAFLAAEAHRRGMAVGLKNAAEIVPRVLPLVQFQVNEQCRVYDECGAFRPFIDAGKPVFAIEYTAKSRPGKAYVARTCGDKSVAGFSMLIKHVSLDRWKISCPVVAASSGLSSRAAGAVAPRDADGDAADGEPLETASDGTTASATSEGGGGDATSMPTTTSDSGSGPGDDEPSTTSTDTVTSTDTNTSQTAKHRGKKTRASRTRGGKHAGQPGAKGRGHVKGKGTGAGRDHGQDQGESEGEGQGQSEGQGHGGGEAGGHGHGHGRGPRDAA